MNLVADRGKPLSVTILERYRRLVKHGLPSVEDRIARKGLTISEIARMTDTNRMTVRKYLVAIIEQEKRRQAAPTNEQMPDGVP